MSRNWGFYTDLRPRRQLLRHLGGVGLSHYDTRMAFQIPITIRKAINHIQKNEYVLPAIQREFIWRPHQITNLFDSLMRGYPIGSFLFWKVDKDHCHKYQYYKFLDSYHQKTQRHNEPIRLTGDQGVTAILDGQQRLTSLNIALKGTFAYKMPRLWWNNPKAFPPRKLYLDIAQPVTDNEVGNKYNFQLLTERGLSHSRPFSHWFPVSEVLEFEGLREINRYLRMHNLLESEYPEDCLFKLYEVVSKDMLINYYEEEDQDLDKVVDIFIRVNSGGTPLSHSDLLLSIATSQWSGRNAREEINGLVDELNSTLGGFSLNKDFVLKTCLVLADISSIEFRVKSFTLENSKKIEDAWDKIQDALRAAVRLVKRFGYNGHSLRSNSVLIPVAYYFYLRGTSEQPILSNRFAEEREAIRNWVTRALLKRGTFGVGLDRVLRTARETILVNPSPFPMDALDEAFTKIHRPLRFTEEELEDLLDQTYGSRMAFSVLALLYPGVDLANLFHIDHIFPRTAFTKSELKKAGIPEDRIGEYQECRHRIGNLQILGSQENLEKSAMMPAEWLRKHFQNDDKRDAWLRRNYTNCVPEDMRDFIGFYESRRANMEKRLAEILGVTLTG